MQEIKIETIGDLKKLKLPIMGYGLQYSDLKIGDIFLNINTISQWDFKNYEDYINIYKNVNSLGNNKILIKQVVTICQKDTDNHYNTELLLKDLSNINIFNRIKGNE